MLRFLATTVLTLIGNALGLLVASWLLEDFNLSVSGFIWSVVFFTIAQLILSPFVLSMSVRYMPILRGGIALATTFIVLILTTMFTDGLTITGVQTWILAPLVIWLVSVLAGVILPLILFRKTLQAVKNGRNSDPEV